MADQSNQADKARSCQCVSVTISSCVPHHRQYMCSAVQSTPDIIMEETKTDSRLEVSEGCEGETEVNPWVADHPLPLWWKVCVILTGPILLPLRLLLMLLIISFSYLCARIALLGGGGRLERKPLRSWRRILQSLVFFNLRSLGVAMGVLVRRRGRQVGREEAPLLVAAPHSTLIDWLVFPWTRSSVLAKQELSSWPVMGVIGRLLQTVWVDRDSQQARSDTVQNIRARCVDPGQYLSSLISLTPSHPHTLTPSHLTPHTSHLTTHRTSHITP